MIRKILPFAVTSLASAILAVALYRFLENPREVVVRNNLPATYAYQGPQPGTTRTGSAYFQSAAPTQFTFAAGKVTSAVVNIKTLQGRSGLGFFRGNPVASASGSGVIISPDGLIATNHHVIENSDQILVTLSDKRELSAQVVGVDPSTDLALIKVEASGLLAIEFGNSDSLQVGEWVLAVGNPFNLESTVTAGIVSAKGRSIDILEGTDRIESFIQTDAAVNPGNSGGALVNTRGELIGINTAIITQSGRYEGYSFAVPSNLALKVIHDLRDYGMVQRGLLGVFIENLNDHAAQSLGLKTIDGVLVTRVTPGSGAEDAGLRRNDVILSINGVKTKTMPEMQEQVGRYRPGNSLKIEYWRQGKRRTATVLLKDRRNSTELVKAFDVQILDDLGMELKNLTQREKSILLVQGVKVVSVRRGSKMDSTNLKPDFIITRVNDRQVNSVDQFLAALRAVQGSRITLRGFYSGQEEPYYYVFDLD
ncbi:MAG: Do family serine endopeptidase [Haliscomenobacter sp.]|nr:Do family serine endopeptidase [Haliscomenobacter sp.]MBP9076612.1 Do family serine endopeptidase [Haliscomenobacter sp.]MBP9873398.1 Do family serine endopeptidase [Haliscomenobacter sp.]